MKKLSILVLISSLLTTTFWSCSKDENKIYLLGGTAPVLTASVSGSIPLNYNTSSETAVKLSWTNPDYKFTTGVSSQDVNYVIEIDTAGANFKNPKRKSIGVSKQLSYTITQSALNDYMLNGMELKLGMEHNLELRIKASLVNNSALLISNVISLKATPYSIPPKVEVPAAGTLWITGSAVASNWSNPLPSAPVDYATLQMFTKLSETKYQLIVNMIPGGGYKLIQKQGDWSSQYSKKSGDELAGEFEKKDATQFDAPTVAGSYKITVDFQTGKYLLEKQ